MFWIPCQNITKQECFDMCRDNTHNVAASDYKKRGAGIIGNVTDGSRADCKFALYDSSLKVNCQRDNGQCQHQTFQKCWLYHHEEMTRTNQGDSKYSW